MHVQECERRKVQALIHNALNSDISLNLTCKNSRVCMRTDWQTAPFLGTEGRERNGHFLCNRPRRGVPRRVLQSVRAGGIR